MASDLGKVTAIVAIPVAAAAIALGCASVLGIPNDSPSFCARPENQGHAYCEDFDVGDPSTRWTETFVQAATTWTLKPSDDSPPNLIALSSPAIPADGGSEVVGFDKEFTGAGFTGVHVEADVRLVPSGGAPYSGANGFLLITDKSGGCVALNFAPQGVGAYALKTAAACGVLTSSHASAPVDAGPDGGVLEMGEVLGPMPAVNKWFHIVVDVTPDASGQGSGTLAFNVVGQPTGYSSLALAAGTLTANGTPLVGFSNAAQPGSGALDVDFDNVTIDLSP